MAALGIAGVLGFMPATSPGFDADPTFKKGTVIFSLQAGGGEQNNVEDHTRISNVRFVNVTPRLSYLPFEPLGQGWLHGAVEAGLEGWFQYYADRDGVTAEGLKLALRYDFLGAGRLVPYVEVTAGAGGSNLEVREIRSTLNFVLEGGAGLLYCITDRLALTAGYRFQHVSNGGVERPNRGINSDTGTVGFSYFFR